MLRRTIHRPAHLYKESAIYFIGASTLARQPLFEPPHRRSLVMEVFDRVAREAGRPIYAWFVGVDHYHILLGVGGKQVPIEPLLGCKEEDAPTRHFDLGRLMNRAHSAIGLLLNREDRMPGRRVFYQYWDRYMRSEGELYTALNYIHNNPVKHGYVENLEQAREYAFSSLPRCHARYGTEWVSECFYRYPVKDHTAEEFDERG